METKVALLLSGGVDSSTALALLKKQGYDVVAFYLKIWLEDELKSLGRCPWEEDLRYARATCQMLGVPLEVVSLQREYFERVVSYAISELRQGFTPSPDIFCNQRIKFGAFLEAVGGEFSKIASGHYGRVDFFKGAYRLFRSPDPVKDQTYFLAHLSQDQLRRVLFPLGSMTKREVRALAKEWNLPSQGRKDSQGICFLGKLSFPEFVRHYLGEKPGKFVEWETGKILGTHKGYWFYTIGQRRGIGLHGGPWYVVQKDVEHNVVYLTHRRHLLDRARSTFPVGHFHWISDLPQEGEILQVKVRHGPKMYKATLHRKGEEGQVVLLEEKDTGIAPGQYTIFYRGQECLGCAKILFDIPAYTEPKK